MRSTANVRDLILAGILLAPNQCVGQAIDSGVMLSPTEPPAGTEQLPVKWVTAAKQQEQPILMAVARPDATGPFPVVILLHGTHGFAHEYVRLAQELANEGLIAVAACWFSGGSGSGARFVTPIGCPQLSLVEPNSPEAVARVATIIQATRTLLGARPDRIALFGHSRGAAAATAYAMQAKDVRAVILNSAGYPPEVTRRAAETQAAVLMLHGVADSPLTAGLRSLPCRWHATLKGRSDGPASQSKRSTTRWAATTACSRTLLSTAMKCTGLWRFSSNT